MHQNALICGLVLLDVGLQVANIHQSLTPALLHPDGNHWSRDKAHRSDQGILVLVSPAVEGAKPSVMWVFKSPLSCGLVGIFGLLPQADHDAPGGVGQGPDL